MGDLEYFAARLNHGFTQPRALLSEHQNTTFRQLSAFERDRVGEDVDTDHGKTGFVRPRGECVNIGMVLDVLISVGDHCTTPVPASLSDDVHAVGKEGVGISHDGSNVEIVLPILDGDVESVAPIVEIGDDRFLGPIAILVDHVAGIAVRQEFGVEMRIIRPGKRMGSNTNCSGLV